MIISLIVCLVQIVSILFVIDGYRLGYFGIIAANLAWVVLAILNPEMLGISVIAALTVVGSVKKLIT
jgi:hypothetical protein